MHCTFVACLYVVYIYYISALMEIDDLTVSGNVLIGDLKNVTSVLISRMSTLSEDFATLNGICTTSTLPPSSCTFLSSIDFNVKVNYSNVSMTSDVTDLRNSFKDHFFRLRM